MLEAIGSDDLFALVSQLPKETSKQKLLNVCERLIGKIMDEKLTEPSGPKEGSGCEVASDHDFCVEDLGLGFRVGGPGSSGDPSGRIVSCMLVCGYTPSPLP